MAANSSVEGVIHRVIDNDKGMDGIRRIITTITRSQFQHNQNLN